MLYACARCAVSVWQGWAMERCAARSSADDGLTSSADGSRALDSYQIVINRIASMHVSRAGTGDRQHSVYITGCALGRLASLRWIRRRSDLECHGSAHERQPPFASRIIIIDPAL